MSGARIEIQGATELIAKLQDLGITVEKRLINKVGRQVLKPVVAEARSKVPVKSGNGRKSLGVKRAKAPRGQIVLMVGPRKGFEYTDEQGKKQDPVMYLLPVEYGHIVRGGRFVPPVPFLRSAYEKNRDSMVEDFQSKLGDEVDTFVEAHR